MSEYIVEVRGQMPDVAYENQREKVVRCRDCKHYVVDEFGDAQCQWFTDYYDQPVHWPEPDGYCAWGERRSE